MAAARQPKKAPITVARPMSSASTHCWAVRPRDRPSSSGPSEARRLEKNGHFGCNATDRGTGRSYWIALLSPPAREVPERRRDEPVRARTGSASRRVSDPCDPGHRALIETAGPPIDSNDVLHEGRETRMRRPIRRIGALALLLGASVAVAGTAAGAPPTAGDDRRSGTIASDALNGLGGDDHLQGREGNDRIAGGTGADRLLGGPGQDVLRGGDGPDLLIGGPDLDVLDGGRGDDLIGAADGLAEDRRLRARRGRSRDRRHPRPRRCEL